MAWVDLSGAFGFGTQLTSAQQQNLRDNITALANGDSGAPSIQTAAIGDLQVTAGKIATGTITTLQMGTASVDSDELATDSVITVKILDANVTLNKLKNANTSASGTISAGGSVNVTLNAYSHYPVVDKTGGSGTIADCIIREDSVLQIKEGSSTDSVDYSAVSNYHTNSKQKILVLRDKITDDIVHVMILDSEGKLDNELKNHLNVLDSSGNEIEYKKEIITEKDAPEFFDIGLNDAICNISARDLFTDKTKHDKLKKA
jgi:hypothetical protein